jgi:hypothetical protein
MYIVVIVRFGAKCGPLDASSYGPLDASENRVANYSNEYEPESYTSLMIDVMLHAPPPRTGQLSENRIARNVPGTALGPTLNVHSCVL